MIVHRAPAPEEIVGLLADPVRRAVVALLERSGPTGLGPLVAAIDRADGRSVVGALGRLEKAGVVERDGADRYALVSDVFARSVRDAASQRIGPLNDRHAQLASRYLYRNRLVQVPSDEHDLDVVLDLIVEDFQPGEVYGEREVNSTLYGWFGDWALLRRLLVDSGRLRREAGRYWREAG